MLRFGSFEVTPETEELRKNGIRIRLTGQPFQILVMLMEHSGTVVTREELRQQLWHGDTHVDFDHCLNTAMNKLREAIGDSAENPRFVQTIPRRGYRFLAPVRETGTAAPKAPAARVAPLESPIRRWPAALAAGAVAVLAVGAAVWLLWGGGTESGPRISPVPLTKLAGTETTPSFSPGGADVAFSWNGEGRDNFDIYALAVAGGQPRRLTDGQADDFGPAYSPDTRHIAFYRRSGDYAGIYLVPVSGGQIERIAGLGFGPPGPSSISSADGSWSPEAPAWSGNQRYLAVVDRESPAAPMEIYLRDLEEHRFHAFSNPPAESFGDGNPAFSPDGQSLAFVRRTTPHAADIYVAPLSRGKPRRLTEDNQAIRGLAWTPDGSEIIFSSERSGTPLLWRVQASGGTPEPVAGIDMPGLLPAVSASGTRLVYARPAEEEGRSVWKVALQPATPDEAAPPGLIAFSASNPRFSPDGKRIAYSSGDAGRPNIWISDADGKNPVPLTSVPTYAASPRWSPDGSFIAFDSVHEGDWDVYVISSEGGEPRKLTAHAGEDVRP
ncbi:MAG: hypothetical protein GY953_24930, partial [bacterium]|nr:hypothetical protein [bacterium]